MLTEVICFSLLIYALVTYQDTSSLISFPFMLSGFCHDCEVLKHCVVSLKCASVSNRVHAPDPLLGQSLRGVLVSVTRALGGDSTHLSHLPASSHGVSAPATVRCTLQPWPLGAEPGQRVVADSQKRLRAGPQPRDGLTLRSRLFNETTLAFEEHIIAVFFVGGGV